MNACIATVRAFIVIHHLVSNCIIMLISDAFAVSRQLSTMILIVALHIASALGIIVLMNALPCSLPCSYVIAGLLQGFLHAIVLRMWFGASLVTIMDPLLSGYSIAWLIVYTIFIG